LSQVYLQYDDLPFDNVAEVSSELHMHWCPYYTDVAQIKKKKKQARQCTYDVTPRRVSETTVAVEKQ
jgi:hypothetical protein